MEAKQVHSLVSFHTLSDRDDPPLIDEGSIAEEFPPVVARHPKDNGLSFERG